MRNRDRSRAKGIDFKKIRGKIEKNLSTEAEKKKERGN
jgi:hypothetical protein